MSIDINASGPALTLSDADFEKLRAIVHENTGITIPQTRKSMMFSRLRSRLRATGETNFKDYIALVSSDAEEMQQLTNRVTTNETYFYRTPRVWSHLREVTIPEYLKTSKGRTMKVWSAAASTGEEGHTVGIVLEETRRTKPGFEYTVLGTDISSRVIEIAQEGCYIGRPVARFRQEDPELFARHMVGNETDGYRVRPEIKRRLTFRLHNLVSKLKAGGPFDVVFLRNVLIYFTPEDQETILANIHSVLRPEGTLFIGESETLNNLACDFEAVAPLVYKKKTASGKAGL